MSIYVLQGRKYSIHITTQTLTWPCTLTTNVYVSITHGTLFPEKLFHLLKQFQAPHKHWDWNKWTEKTFWSCLIFFFENWCSYLGQWWHTQIYCWYNKTKINKQPSPVTHNTTLNEKFCFFLMNKKWKQFSPHAISL